MKRQAQVLIGLLKLLSWLPLSWARRLGSLFGVLLWLIPNRSKTVTLINLHHCYPDLSEAAIQNLAKQSLKQTAILACEMGATWSWPLEKCLNHSGTIHGESQMQQCFDEGKGVLVLLPHIGNWEMLGPYLGSTYPVTAMYQPPKMKGFESVMIAARERNQLKTVPTSPKGIISLVKALKAGEMVVVLPDQVPNVQSSGVYAPFMGMSALTMRLISKLIRKSGANVMMAYVLREDKGFSVHFDAVDDGIKSDDETESATVMNAAIADVVAKAPAQYQWEYKRFKRQPNGLGLYKKYKKSQKPKS